MTDASVPRSPLRILFVVSSIDVLGFGVVIPLLPYLGLQLGASPQLVMMILGSYSLCQLIAAPFWGRLSDRYGRRPILMSSLAGACLSYVILALAHSLWLLLLSRAIAGFMAGNLAAAFAYASDVSRPEDRARSMGLVGAAIGIGFLIGIPLGGALAGNDPATANFLRPSLVSVALSLLAIALVKWRLPESRAPAASAEAAARAHPWTLLRTRPVLRAIAAAALGVTCAQGILEYYFGIWALKRFGAGPRTVGLALGVVGLLTVLMQGRFVRALVPRLGEPLLGGLGAASYALGLVCVGLAGQNVPIVGLGLVLAGLGLGAFTPSASALASKQSLPSDRGAVMGTYQASTSLARAIGPYAAALTYAELGVNAPLLTAACLAVPAAWLVWNAPRRSLEEQPDALTAGSRSRRS